MQAPTASTGTVSTPGSAAHLGGSVHGGQPPVSGAQVYLYAIGTTAGGPSQSLLTTPGGYVLTDANGNWSISGDYTCPANAYVYILALGGNPGLAAGKTNPKLSLASYLGACSSLNSGQFFIVNEVTTVVAASVLSGIAASETQISSPNLTAVANTARLNTTLIDPFGGTANTITPDRTGTVPQAKINSLADSVAACVNSDGTGDMCQQLMDASGLSNTTLTPDTFNAAIVIAQQPANDPYDIFTLVLPEAPFQPTLIDFPVDWSLAPQYSGESQLGNGTSIAPSSATIAAGTQVTLTTGGGVSYLWSNSAVNGQIADPNSLSGTKFCSTSPSVTYTSAANASLQAPSPDVVAVQVFVVANCLGNPEGAAAAAVTTVPATPSLLPASPSATFTGQVVLPGNVPLPLDALTVLDSITQTTPDSSGNFTLPYYSSGPQIVVVTTPDGTPVLAGWLDGNHTTVDESTTAEVLAFYALGGASMLSEADRLAAIAQIPQLSAFSALVGVVDSELNANADALAAPDANLTAALNTFYTQTAGALVGHAGRSGLHPQDILIDPTAAQSGVTVSNEEPGAPYATSSTITPWSTYLTNAFRRRTHYFVQKTQEDGMDLGGPVQVSDADVAPTAGVNGGVTGALTDIIKAYFGNQATAYAPVTTDPLNLTVDSGYDTTTYQIINVGAGGSGAPFPVQLTSAQQAVLVTTAVNGFVNDVMVPVINNVLINAANDPDSAANTPISGSSNSPFVLALEQNIANIVNQLPGEQDKLVAGDYKTVFGDLFFNAGTQPLVTSAVKSALAAAVPTASVDAAGKSLNKFLIVLNAAGAGLQVFDTSVYFTQLAQSDNVDLWTITSSNFKATLTPAATTFTKLSSVALQATVLNAPTSAQLSYLWTIAPQAGQPLVGSITENGGAGRTLPDSGGKMSVCSSTTNWTYANNAAAFQALTAPATDTVTVTGYYGPNCVSGQDITNTPSATITNNANANVVITPATSTIEAGEYVALTAAFTDPKLQTQQPPASWLWQLNGAAGTVYGTLSGAGGTAAASGATFCSASSSAQYTSTQSDPVTTSQLDQVQANAYAQANCQGTALAKLAGIATITTRATPNLVLSPSSALLQAGETTTFTVTSSGNLTGFSYLWTTPGVVGTLTDPVSGNTGLRSVCITSNAVTLVANTVPGLTTPLMDTVAVKAYAAAGCLADNQFGRSNSAPVTLQAKPVLTYTPTQMLGQMVASDGNIYAVGATYTPFSLFYPLINFPAQLAGDTLFRITPNGQVSALVDFKYPTVDNLQGGNIMTTPSLSPLVEGPDDALYGITQTGPTATDNGYFFKVSLADYSVTVLQKFPAAAAGVFPDAKYGPPLLASDGNWYINSDMGVIKLTPYGQASVFNQYPAGAGEAAYPLMQASDGNLYTINWGGVGGPSYAPAMLQSISLGGSTAAVATFGIPTSFGTLTFLADAPLAPIVQGADGALYITTSGERPGFNACQGYGVNNVAYCAPVPAASIFRFNPNGSSGTLYNFTSLPAGTTPHTGLTPGPDGNLYGMSAAGGDTGPECYTFDPSLAVQPGSTYSPTTTVGDEGCGTLFQITPAGAYTPMYTFRNAAEGRISTGQSNPVPLTEARATLALDQSGNLVGAGGISGAGVYTLSATQDFKLPLFPQGPVQMSFNTASISLGSSATLTWTVANAFSLGAQQCYAHNIAAGSGGGAWTGLQPGVLDSTGFHGSANIQPTLAGTYTYALTCGGIESGFATLTVH